MAKQNLMLVDADLRSLRVLEVSLRKSGYGIVTANSAEDALEKMAFCNPDLVLCDTRLPGMDGYAFVSELRRQQLDVPVIALSSDTGKESKMRSLESGVDDFLTKPLYVNEVLIRIGLVLQRRRREGIEQRGNKKVTGTLSDIGVVDLLQTIDTSKKSGVLYLTRAEQRGAIYFRNGNPIAAELGHLRGARAIYRALVWMDGHFEIEFRDVDREDDVQTRTPVLLMEGMRRLDEWARLSEQLPGLDGVLAIREEELFSKLADVPDALNTVLRQIDGQRSVLQVVDACDDDDLETLNGIAQLYSDGMVADTGRRSMDGSDDRALSPVESGEYAQVLVPGASSDRPPVDATDDEHSARKSSSAPRPASRSGSHRVGTVTSRLVRVRKPHKRKKRMDWTTAPGLLSTHKPRHDDEPTSEVRDSPVQHPPSSLPPQPLLLPETSAWLKPVRVRNDTAVLPVVVTGSVRTLPPPAAHVMLPDSAGRTLGPPPIRAPSLPPLRVPNVRLVSDDTAPLPSPAPALPLPLVPAPSSIPAASPAPARSDPLLAHAAEQMQVSGGESVLPLPRKSPAALVRWASLGAVLMIAAWLVVSSRSGPVPTQRPAEAPPAAATPVAPATAEVMPPTAAAPTPPAATAEPPRAATPEPAQAEPTPPPTKNAAPPESAAQLSRKAFGYLNKGRNGDAAKFAARALEADNSNSEAWIVLGAARFELGDHKGAKDAYRSCVERGRGGYVAECRRMLR